MVPSCSLRGDYDLADLLVRFQVAVRRDDVVEAESPVDDRLQLRCAKRSSRVRQAGGPACEHRRHRGGYRRGLVAMANSGPNTNGSQFFIMHRDYELPPDYVIFGRVTSGLDVVDAIANTPTTIGADGGMSKPVTPPVIKHVTVQP